MFLVLLNCQSTCFSAVSSSHPNPNPPKQKWRAVLRRKVACSHSKARKKAFKVNPNQRSCPSLEKKENVDMRLRLGILKHSASLFFDSKVNSCFDQKKLCSIRFSVKLQFLTTEAAQPYSIFNVSKLIFIHHLKPSIQLIVQMCLIFGQKVIVCSHDVKSLLAALTLLFWKAFFMIELECLTGAHCLEVFDEIWVSKTIIRLKHSNEDCAWSCNVVAPWSSIDTFSHRKVSDGS